jgi:ATP-dependent RNA helicase DeaD
MRRIMDFNPNMYGIVFCRTRRETQSIAEQLITDGYRAEALHGDLSQAQRDEVMNRFRKRKLNVMVATDVAARGIDVNELTHVINVNIPDDPEVYVHRSGRTGRAGSSGVSIVITHGRNMRKVNNLERIIGKEFEQKQVPSGEAICEIKIGQAIDELVEFEFANELDPMLLDSAMDKLAHLSKAELIERFLGHETSLILSRYRGARDINEQPKKFKEHGPRKSGGGGEEGFKTIVVDLGYRQNVNPSRLIGLINDTMEGKKIRIGKIDMDKTFTRIDVEERFAVEVAVRLSGAKTGSYVVNAYFEEGSGSSGGASGGQRRQKRERISTGKNSAVIIASKTEVAVGIVAMISAATTIARESDATTEVVISEAATTAVHATVVTALRLIQTVHAHVVGTVVHEVKTEAVQKESQAENATRSTKLSCILGV